MIIVLKKGAVMTANDTAHNPDSDNRQPMQQLEDYSADSIQS